jgi:rare lipoprotein A
MFNILSITNTIIMNKLFLTVIFLGLYTTSSFAATVHASWYGPGFHGKKTASGEIFNQNDMTAAHKTLPFGTIVKVSYNGKSVKVRINDRGPFIKGRTIDLSKAAAQKIGCDGVCLVDMQVLN